MVLAVMVIGILYIFVSENANNKSTSKNIRNYDTTEKKVVTIQYQYYSL